MAAGLFNIPKLEQGATFKLRLRMKVSEGVWFDLTGHQFRGAIRRTTSDETVQAQFEFNILDQASEETKGMVDVSITAENTSKIAVNSSRKAVRNMTEMCYDIESERNGEVVRWLEGTVNISPEVTR